MSNYIYTEKQSQQYNGPLDSSLHNSRIEKNYQDLIYLYNKYGVFDEEMRHTFERILKDHIFLTQALLDIEQRVQALEYTDKVLSLFSHNQIDTLPFIGTEFEVPSTQALSFNAQYNYITLPMVPASSYSKVKTIIDATSQVVPEYFETKVETNYAGIDVAGSIIDTTPTYYAILDKSDKVWKRSIIANAENVNGAQMMFYVRVPAFQAGTKVNNLRFTPFPLRGVDIVSIEYTTKESPKLDSTDGWQPLNDYALYNGDTNAVGHVAPGGWVDSTADRIYNAGPLNFYFSPDLGNNTSITAFRIKMHQRNCITENSKFIYTYGLSDLDIRFDRFLSAGKTIIRFDAPESSVINTITSVTPRIWNVPQSLISSVFSYRVLYHAGGGVYTTVNPGNNNSVWIEVNLSLLDDNTPPVISDFIIKYT